MLFVFKSFPLTKFNTLNIYSWMNKRKKSRFAVIDLGSNTFHLLIVKKKDGGQIETLYRDRCYVKLASGGKKNISPEAFERGIECLSNFKNHLNKYHVTYTKIIGTAMLRTAENAEIFINKAMTLLNLNIEIIDGSQEAKYISQGVQHFIPSNLFESSLILDIGGGSVECIVHSKKELKFSKSYPIGIAILKNLFHHTDPILTKDLAKLKKFLDTKLETVSQMLQDYKIDTVIGCSGSFEILALMGHGSLDSWHALNLVDAQHHLAEIINSNYRMRMDHALIPVERADLIVVASVLINWFLSLNQIQKLVFCPYALKEGVLLNLIENKETF